MAIFAHVRGPLVNKIFIHIYTSPCGQIRHTIGHWILTTSTLCKSGSGQHPMSYCMSDLKPSCALVRVYVDDPSLSFIPELKSKG